MLNLLTVVVVLLLILAIGALYRILTLLNILNGNFRKPSSANSINAYLFPIFFIILIVGMFWYEGVASKLYLPVASIHGVETDFLFWLTTGIITVVFVGLHILMGIFIVNYKHDKDNKALFYPDNHKLELIWTVIPAIVLSVLVFTGWKAWAQITSEAPKESVTLELMGKQFNWLVRYPGVDNKFGKTNYKLIDASNEMGVDFTDKNSHDDFMPREIHIPVNQPILFKIRARDVLHSVYAPHFRLKMDAVPGMPTKFWFTATKTTEDMKAETGNSNFKYEVACTEVCGKGHFAMRYIIVVETEEEYNKWMKEQDPMTKTNPEFLIKAGVIVEPKTEDVVAPDSTNKEVIALSNN